MDPTNKKLDSFLKYIASEADGESSALRKEIEEGRSAALAAAEDEALADAYKTIRNQVSRIRTEAGCRISQEVLESKRALSVRREEIAQEVLSAVCDRLAQFVTTDAYPVVLLRQATAGKALLPSSPVQIHVCPRDLSLASVLSKDLPDVTILEDSSIQLGGLILQDTSGKYRVDCTFDNALAEIGSHFAELADLGLTAKEENRHE